MDPFTLIFIGLAVYGALHAGRNGVRVARASAALTRTNAQGNLPKGSPKSIMKDTRRRAGAGWWLREAKDGFPVTLGGVREGWHAHTEAAAKHKADDATRRAKLAVQLARYKAQLDAAQAKIDASRPPAPAVQTAPARQPGHPVMSPPPASARGFRPRAWNTPSGQAPAGQAPGNQTASTQTAGGNGQTVTTPPINPADWAKNPDANCTDQDCPYCHAPSGSNGSSGQPSGQPSASSTGGSNMSDLTYDGMIMTCEKIQHHIDQMVNTQELSEAETMADQMGAALPDDTESLGLAGDLVSALRAVKEAQVRAGEAAEALKNMVEKNHGAANEAAKATGHMAQREVHTNA